MIGQTQVIVTKVEEPTCCGCCDLQCGCITMLVLTALACINSFATAATLGGLGIFDGIWCLLIVVCGTVAMATKSKLVCFATSVFYGIKCVISIIYAILCFTFTGVVADAQNVHDDHKAMATGLLAFFGVLFLLVALLFGYFCSVWIKIGRWYEQEFGEPIVIVQGQQNQGVRTGPVYTNPTGVNQGKGVVVQNKGGSNPPAYASNNGTGMV